MDRDEYVRRMAADHESNLSRIDRMTSELLALDQEFESFWSFPGTADSDINCIAPYDQRELATAREHVKMALTGLKLSIQRYNRYKNRRAA